MGEITVLTADQPGPAAVSEAPQNQGQVDRGFSVFVVDIDGEKISSTGHERLITKVMTEESDEQIDIAVVEMSNVDVSITDDRIFREGSKIKISTGWKNTNLVPRGIFLARRPKFKFTLPGRRVAIVADGEGIKMARTKRRRSFLGSTHSEIATQIATENEFEVDVEATTIRYPQISQMIESDWEFLKRLAKFSGFLMYVEQGTLHFHSLRTEDSDITLSYGDADSILSGVEIKIEGEGRSVVARMSQYDPLEGSIIDVTSENRPDGLLDPSASETRVRRFGDLAAVRDVFVTNEGQILSQAELQRLVDAVASSRKFIVRLSAKGKGVEGVRARRLVEFTNIGRFSGKYYVNRVMHKITSKTGYEMEISAVRAFTGELLPSPSALSGDIGDPVSVSGSSDDVTDQSQIEGELNLVTGITEIF